MEETSGFSSQNRAMTCATACYRFLGCACLQSCATEYATGLQRNCEARFVTCILGVGAAVVISVFALPPLFHDHVLGLWADFWGIACTSVISSAVVTVLLLALAKCAGAVDEMKSTLAWMWVLFAGTCLFYLIAYGLGYSLYASRRISAEAIVVVGTGLAMALVVCICIVSCCVRRWQWIVQQEQERELQRHASAHRHSEDTV